MTDGRDGLDRAAILARRTLLVSSALASLSCGTTPPAEPTEGAVTISVPEPSSAPPASALPSASASGSAPFVAELGTWQSVLARSPSREVPASLPLHVTSLLESMNQQLEPTVAGVRALWEGGAGLCDPGNPECRAAWRALGEKLSAARDRLRGLSPGLCGGSPQPPAIAARLFGHQDFWNARISEAEAHFTKLAASFGPLAEQEWQRAAANSRTTPPMPCLSCVAPRTWLITQMVVFEPGSAVLDAKAKAAIKEVASSFAAKPTPLEIWGIALGSEKDPPALAKKRAEAVRDELVKGGYQSSLLTIVPIGDGLRETGREPRVEFLMKS